MIFQLVRFQSLFLIYVICLALPKLGAVFEVGDEDGKDSRSVKV